MKAIFTGILLFASTAGAATTGKIISRYTDEMKYEVTRNDMAEYSDFTGTDLVYSANTKFDVSLLIDTDVTPIITCYEGDIKKSAKVMERIISNTDGNGDYYVENMSVRVSGKTIKASYDLVGEGGSQNYTLDVNECGDLITYFSCNVKEPVGKKTVDVKVKFAISGFEPFKGKGELIRYPVKELSEESGAIYVTPETLKGGEYTKMSNLNGQGGDLRIDENSGDIRLFGDGAGYQFTDLILWNDAEYKEGYVRDYGSAYGESPTFKQFITCKTSLKLL